MKISDVQRMEEQLIRADERKKTYRALLKFFGGLIAGVFVPCIVAYVTTVLTIG